MHKNAKVDRPTASTPIPSPSPSPRLASHPTGRQQKLFAGLQGAGRDHVTPISIERNRSSLSTEERTPGSADGGAPASPRPVTQRSPKARVSCGEGVEFGRRRVHGGRRRATAASPPHLTLSRGVEIARAPHARVGTYRRLTGPRAVSLRPRELVAPRGLAIRLTAKEYQSHFTRSISHTHRRGSTPPCESTAPITHPSSFPASYTARDRRACGTRVDVVRAVTRRPSAPIVFVFVTRWRPAPTG